MNANLGIQHQEKIQMSANDNKKKGLFVVATEEGETLGSYDMPVRKRTAIRAGQQIANGRKDTVIVKDVTKKNEQPVVAKLSAETDYEVVKHSPPFGPYKMNRPTARSLITAVKKGLDGMPVTVADATFLYQSSECTLYVKLNELAVAKKKPVEGEEEESQEAFELRVANLRDVAMMKSFKMIENFFEKSAA
jgi:hypothetical protein